jgi:hypothetical protein
MVADRGYEDFSELRQGEVRRILLLRGWVNKGPLLPSGDKSHGPHRTITPYVCMLNMGCGLGAGNDSSFI